MKKINLKDVSFLIPIRIDSKERIENLALILEFIKKNFDTTIIVLEADIKEQIENPFIDKKIFIEDNNPIFHRTRYLNLMTLEANTPIISIWDADVITKPEQIEKAVMQIRNDKADMVFPYNGEFYNVPEIIRNIYLKDKRLKLILDNKNKFLTIYGHFSVGGAFIVNRSSYIMSGMENENFYGWGPEDIERVKRWEILENRIERVEGALFHFSHPRKINSWYGSKKLELKNRRELIKICSMNKKELLNYKNEMRNSSLV